MLSRSEINQKRRAAEVAKLLRKKFNDYKRDVQNAEQTYFQEHKQVIQPLRTIASKINGSVQAKPLLPVAVKSRASSPNPSSIPKQRTLTAVHQRASISALKSPQILPATSASIKQAPQQLEFDTGDDSSDNISDVDPPRYEPINDTSSWSSQEDESDRDDYDDSDASSYELDIESLEHMSSNDIADYYSQIVASKKKYVDDSRYGMKFVVPGVWKLGRSKVYLQDDNLVLSKQSYHITPGLFNLLTLKTPKKYTESDIKSYRNMILSSNAHRKYYRRNEPIQPADTLKFENVLRSFLITSPKEGYGMFKKVKDASDIEFVHWRTFPELIKRLRLLIASKWAGNNSHDNEINSIIEVLKKEHIIR